GTGGIRVRRIPDRERGGLQPAWIRYIIRAAPRNAALLWPAVQPEPADAAIGVDVEPDVGHVADGAHVVFERVLRVRAERQPRRQLAPGPPVDGPFQIARAGGVALEMTRVDFDPANGAG